VPRFARPRSNQVNSLRGYSARSRDSPLIGKAPLKVLSDWLAETYVSVCLTLLPQFVSHPVISGCDGWARINNCNAFYENSSIKNVPKMVLVGYSTA